MVIKALATNYLLLFLLFHNLNCLVVFGSIFHETNKRTLCATNFAVSLDDGPLHHPTKVGRNTIVISVG